MRKLICFAVILFMIPVLMALAMTSTSPTAINGNEITAITAEASATIVYANGMIMDATREADTISINSVNNSAGADLITAEIAKMTTAQNTGIDIASSATKTNGKIRDGASTMVIMRNTDAANNGPSTTIIAMISPVTGNNSEWIQIYGATAGATNGVYFYQVEAILVLKLPIPAVDANTAINTPTAILSTDNAGNTNATIDYSIQSGQNVRTLVKANENQAATYRTDGVTMSAAEQIAMPTLAMINSAANTYFTDITVTAMVQNQENAAYANDLAAIVSEGNTFLTSARTAGNAGTKTMTMADNSPNANMTDTNAMTRPATPIHSDITMGIAGAGLVALNFA